MAFAYVVNSTERVMFTRGAAEPASAASSARSGRVNFFKLPWYARIYVTTLFSHPQI
jgi:hypothetical protein